MTEGDRKRSQLTYIRDKAGDKLTKLTEMCNRWKEYTEELYDREQATGR